MSFHRKKVALETKHHDASEDWEQRKDLHTTSKWKEKQKEVQNSKWYLVTMKVQIQIWAKVISDLDFYTKQD